MNQLPLFEATAMSEAIERIEIDFAIPVAITQEQYQQLCTLVQAIAKANQYQGRVHWLSGMGYKPHYSQVDAQFLGKSVDAHAPMTGEPTYDDRVLYFETYEREDYD